MLFLLRLLLRKEWIAGAVFVAIMTLAGSTGSTTPVPDCSLNALAFAILAFALLRYGLLAAIVATASSQILELSGVLDFSAWYAGMAVIPCLLMAGIAAYGFRTALGGRKLLKEEL
jgi:hypothetical protein